MDNKKVINYIVNWISDYANNQTPSIKSLVIGVSGGIDSALTSMLCAMTGIKTILVKIPLHTKDITLSRDHCLDLQKKFKNIDTYEISLSETFDKFKEICLEHNHNNELGFANSKSRLRMLLLYQIAQSSSGIVVGTGNKVEDFGVGFFTKYGDGGVDISPIADCTKSQIWEMGKSLGVLKEIIEAQPTDGLWDDGRTDANQLGMSYQDLEAAMKDSSNKNHKKYLEIRKRNLHKMNSIPVCKMKDE